jgi:hypothetical protein
VSWLLGLALLAAAPAGLPEAPPPSGQVVVHPTSPDAGVAPSSAEDSELAEDLDMLQALPELQDLDLIQTLADDPEPMR